METLQTTALDIAIIEKENLIDQIIVWMCDEAKSKGEIKRLILSTHAHLELTEDDALALINQSINKLNEKFNNKEYFIETVKEHIEIYERIYAYYKEINHAAGMNKAMQAKERLLNILKENNQIIFKKTNTVITNSDRRIPEYDENKLSQEDRDTMKFLLAKCKI